MEAKAVVFEERNVVRYRTVECSDPGPDDAVVSVTHSWISNGTEGSFLRGERFAGDTALRPGHPDPFPIVAGYQKIGVVEQVGEGIEDLAVGETVFCAMGRVNGMFEQFGGHVSPSIAPRSMIWKLPGGVDPLAFSGLVLTQVGYNCGVKAPIEPGEGAVVVGDGMVGHWAAQTLAWRGAEVLLVGRHEDRLARFQGERRHTVSSNKEDWKQMILDLFPKKVAVAVDTIGSVPVMNDFLGLMRRYGHMVSAGFYGTDDLMSLQALRLGELSVDMVSGWAPDRMQQTIELIASGDLDTLGLITHRFPVEQAAEAWDVIREKRGGALGVILEW